MFLRCRCDGVASGVFYGPKNSSPPKPLNSTLESLNPLAPLLPAEEDSRQAGGSQAYPAAVLLLLLPCL